MRSKLVLAVTVLFVAVAFVQANEAEQYNEIRQLLSKGKLDEAEKSFAAALEAHPESARLKSLHILFYSYLNRAKRPLDAARHAEANVEFWLDNVSRSPRTATNLARHVGYVTSSYTRLEKHDVAIQKLDEVVGKVETLLEEKESVEVAALVTQLRASKSLLLVGAGREDEARALIDSVRDAATTKLEANPDDLSAALGLANVLSVHAELESKGEKAAEAQKEHLDFLTEQAKKRSSDYTIISAYYSAQLSALSNLLRSDAAQAEAQLDVVREFLASLNTNNRQIASLVKSSERTFSSYERRIESAKVQQALIGQPSFPLEVDAWVNGDEITEKELEGKVVLIDFWAVWCGPCIATFPHLRGWREKYADQGLVIIGATKYYSYDWDDGTDRIKKVKDLSPEDERAALVRFADHHDLKHRFMVMPKDSGFSKKHGVTGIPTAVLIGRDGKIQLIRVGSGEANAHDLEAKIEELLAASG